MSFFIRPFTVTPATLIYSNIAEEAAWVATTPYAKGDLAARDYRLWESTGGTAPVTASSTNPASDTVFFAAPHGCAVDDRIAFRSTGTLPGGLSAVLYWVKSIPTTTTLTLSLTQGGATVDITSDGTGVLTGYRNPNWGNTPTSDIDDEVEVYWLDTGPMNKWAMFDDTNSTTTTNAGEIEVEVQAEGRMDSVALLAMKGATSATITSEVDAVVVYDETFSLANLRAITDWWSYFFEEVTYDTTLIVNNIPNAVDPLIGIALNGPGSVSIGSAVIGLSKQLGDVQWGAKVTLKSYSRWVQDDFGVVKVTPRGSAKRNDWTIFTPANMGDQVFEALDQYRDTPLVWVGTPARQITVVYGFLRDLQQSISYPSHDVLTATIEGMP